MSQSFENWLKYGEWLCLKAVPFANFRPGANLHLAMSRHKFIERRFSRDNNVFLFLNEFQQEDHFASTVRCVDSAQLLLPSEKHKIQSKSFSFQWGVED